MENLKLTSIRLSKSVLARANEIAKVVKYYSTSDVIRLAIWVGLKFMKPGVIIVLMQMKLRESVNATKYSAGDVLQSIGDSLENLKSLE